MTRTRKQQLRWAAGAFLITGLLLGLSSLYPGSFGMNGEPGSGRYALVSEQDGTALQFQGPVYFETTEASSALDRDRFFKLHFIHPNMGSGNGFGFLIPLRHEESEIRESRYRIEQARDGSQQSTVFGYADILAEGGGLYFTEAGSISILEVGPSEVSGVMNMVMKNALGREMKVRGRFSAQPLRGNGAD